MKRAFLLGLLLALMVAARVGLSPTASRADDPPVTQILEHSQHADKAAVQARGLAWAAVVLGVLNLLVIGFVVLRLAGVGPALLGSGEWPVRAIRRRQAALAKSISELNAHFEDVDTDRKHMLELMQSINDQLRVTEEDIEATIALREHGAGGSR